ncbi:MAG: terminase family protein [Pseudomonadota bacterium]
MPDSAELPTSANPIADGILMKHQLEWIYDEAPLKIAEKCRRSGFTFAEALDDTLTAATTKSEGGRNVFYIGDTKDKGREFIGYCAHFARTVVNEPGAIEEFFFEDQREDGSTNQISAFRIKFASGCRIEALSSRPENIRGLQGVVVIDEAAFHKDVGEVIDAAQALLIWGGRIRIISTHNGAINKFNDLVTRTRAGKTPYSLHSITFDEVIENGLYERAKLMQPELLPFDEWYNLVRSGYTDEARMREELDTIPRDAEGAALSRVQVEACRDHSIQVLRYSEPDSFKNAPADTRFRQTRDWLEKHVGPILADRIDINRRSALGCDIARRGHASAFWLAQIGGGQRRETVVVVEARNVPFDQLFQIFCYIADRSGRRWSGAIDASGLGMQLAENAAQKYGSRVAEVTISSAWYKENGTRLVTSIEDRIFTVPADEDIISDICALQYVNGIVKIPEGHETIGEDGGKRHADGAIAAMMVEEAAGAEPGVVDVRTAGARAPGSQAYSQGLAPKAQEAAERGAGFGTVPSGLNLGEFMGGGV